MSRDSDGFPIRFDIYKVLLFPHFLQFNISEVCGGSDCSGNGEAGGVSPSTMGCRLQLSWLNLFISDTIRSKESIKLSIA